MPTKKSRVSPAILCCLVMFAAAAAPGRAQTTSSYQWTWVGGSNSICTDTCGDLSYGHLGVYGRLGVPSTGNLPGSRFGSSTWTDKNGNLWLFGGQGVFDVLHGSYGNFNDLWRFNPTTREWTWMTGSISPVYATGAGQPGVYGTLGVPSAANTPGGRNSALSWTGQDGRLWLFGGYGTDDSGNGGWLGDLWEFDPAANVWTWMGGSSTIVPLQYGNYGRPGVYGVLGTPDAANIPGSRSLAATWTDTNGNLWIFGGEGFDANGTGAPLNDVWEFNPATSQWAWMGGSSTIPTSGSIPGVYGTLGTAASANTPGQRSQGASWTDTSGNLWTFGGVGLDANGHHGWLNDLWKFDPQSHEWAWMGGSSTIPASDTGQPGAYGTLGSPASGNVPGGRYSAAGWTDRLGNFWLFGGEGMDANGHFGELDDLWEFDPSTHEWTWFGGSSALTLTNYGTYNEPGVYGTLGTPAAANHPGSRNAAMTWIDSNGYFWFFGGWGYDANNLGGEDLNDFWTYQPASALTPAATPVFNPAGKTYTAAQSVTISDASPGATIYYTSDGTSPTTSSTVYSGPINLSSTATLKAFATAPGYSPSATATATYTINLPPPGFTVTGTAITVTRGATSGNTSTITLTPSGGFTGAIALSCAITPKAANAPATCSLPASVTIGGAAAQTATLTVNTTAATTALNPSGNFLWRSAGGAALACVLLAGFPARRRRNWKILLVTLFMVAGAMIGCGGTGSSGSGGNGGGGNSGTTPGSYVVTVTGTSGTITQNGTISLTVQ